jgi:hypothetical protein
MAFALTNNRQPEIINKFCISRLLQNTTIKFNNMKKIFTLAFGLMITAAILAADRRPDVTITSMKKYEVVIDGRSYLTTSRTMDLNLRSGRHSIQVYEANKSFSIFKRKRMVASSSFELRNRDVKIMIDRFGQLNIAEDRFGGNDYGKDQKGWDDRSNSRDDRGQDQRGGNNSNKGQADHGNRKF